MSIYWRYSHISTIEVMRMSGWKLYVYGESNEDAEYVEAHITPICRAYNLTVKIATPSIIARNLVLKPAWGVGVIYLNVELFENQLVNTFIQQVTFMLRYYSKRGHSAGARAINSFLSCRYDLNVPVPPDKGLVYDHYLKNYRGEFGEYNIPDNDCLLQLIGNQKSATYG